MTDPKTGISIRFIRQWSVDEDRWPKLDVETIRRILGQQLLPWTDEDRAFLRSLHIDPQ